MERADFVAIPVQDLQRADEFYGKTLGLDRNPNSSERWVEYELGNVTLALVSPEAMGPDFRTEGHQMPIGVRLADVAAGLVAGPGPGTWPFETKVSGSKPFRSVKRHGSSVVDGSGNAR